MEMGKELSRLENSEPAKQELPAPRSGDPGTLEVALQGIPLREADYTEFSGALKYAMVKVGLRAENWPKAEEKFLLLEHIRKEYGNHTAAEVRLAFDMALTGRLSIDLKNVICYENFSCLYFSGIMNAYRAWAVEEEKQIKRVVPELPAEKQERVDTEGMEEWWLGYVAKVQAGGYIVELTPRALYDWMESQGRITAKGPEKRHYLALAAERTFRKLAEDYQERLDIATRRALTEFADMKDAGEFTGEYVEELKWLAKKMILYNMALNHGK